MIDADFQPSNYGDNSQGPVLLARLHYPESQWGEDISIFVSQEPEGFAFEASDFYGNDFILDPAFSVHPLALREVIRMIETMRPLEDRPAGNLGLTLMGIPEVTSDIYPGLSE